MKSTTFSRASVTVNEAAAMSARFKKEKEKPIQVILEYLVFVLLKTITVGMSVILTCITKDEKACASQ